MSKHLSLHACVPILPFCFLHWWHLDWFLCSNFLQRVQPWDPSCHWPVPSFSNPACPPPEPWAFSPLFRRDDRRDVCDDRAPHACPCDHGGCGDRRDSGVPRHVYVQHDHDPHAFLCGRGDRHDRDLCGLT